MLAAIDAQREHLRILQLGAYPSKSIFATANGGASVLPGNADNDLALAQEDCATAVVEDLVTKRVIRAIHTQLASPPPATLPSP